ncbi:MAG: Flp family type IVb pilin [Terracidiphilus sp.]|jgi:Flp pilus assembly pilin Flp
MNAMLFRLYVTFQELMHGEEGQDLVEYALVVGMISCGAVVAMGGLAGGINLAFTNISTSFAHAI